MPTPEPIAAGQPVSVFMKGESMASVPLNHALHEKNLPSCSICHHQGMQACGTCHVSSQKISEQNTAEKTPTAFTSMHKRDTTHSCGGCHEQRQLQYLECAGCHAQLPKQTGAPNRNCAFCHRPAPMDVVAIMEGTAPETPAPEAAKSLPPEQA